MRRFGLVLLVLGLAAALAISSVAGGPRAAGAPVGKSFCNIPFGQKMVDLVALNYPRPRATIVPGAPAPPRMEWPSNGVRLDTISPSFTINNGSLGQQARARVEYSRNPAFAPVDWWFSFSPFQGSTTAPMDKNLLEGTTYYWRTRSSLDGVLWGDWSSVWSFFTPSGGAVAGTPTLISPASGSTASSLRPRFRWNTVPGATRYALAIAQYVFILPGNDFTLTHDLSPGLTYDWTVAARNAYGWGSESEEWTINVPATLTVGSEAAPPADALAEITRDGATVIVVD